MDSVRSAPQTAGAWLLTGLLALPLMGPCAHNAPPESVSAASQPDADRSAPATYPWAVASQTEHDFGSQAPDAKGTCEFSVSNRGTAPLELSAGPDPDAALSLELPGKAIPPAETATLRVTWKAGREGSRFQRSVTVRTNDPSHETLVLTVLGRVLANLATEPRVLDLDEIDPRREASAATTIYSQLWEACDEPQIACSIPGLTWTVVPATPETLQQLAAKCGYQVTVTTPLDLPRGGLQGALQVRLGPATASTTEPADPVNLEVPIRGRVLRRFALYGAGVESNGTLALGNLRAGEGHRHRLLMKIRDPEPQVKIARVQTQPDFLRVGIYPLEGDPDSPARGLYQFVVEVPPEAPPCEHLGIRPGKVHIELDHPRTEDLDLDVHFSIRPRR